MNRLLVFKSQAWLLIALLLVAFGLRVYHLDTQISER
jgi:hypothetical protein